MPLLPAICVSQSPCMNAVDDLTQCSIWPPFCCAFLFPKGNTWANGGKFLGVQKVLSCGFNFLSKIISSQIFMKWKRCLPYLQGFQQNELFWQGATQNKNGSWNKSRYNFLPSTSHHTWLKYEAVYTLISFSQALSFPEYESPLSWTSMCLVSRKWIG